MLCFYYPTTTVAIDDDIQLLNLISQQLGGINYHAYTSPRTALIALKKQNQRINNTSVIHYLHESIYSIKRFNETSVIIVDYYMDGTNGIEVCEQLIDHPAKKILLTGGADKEKIAIDAFNRGIIHQFISKLDANFSHTLNQTIQQLKKAYFAEAALQFTGMLDANVAIHLAYAQLIEQLKQQYNSIEWYLLDEAGSQLLLDADGNPTWVVIMHESEINNYLDIANNQEGNYHLAATLANKEMIPFFFLDEDFQQPPSKWGDYLYQAKPLPKMKGYYYSIIDGHINSNLQLDNIMSYNMYKNEKTHEMQI